MYKPTELRSFLESLNIHPKKGLSQNFLIDGNIIKKIIKTADASPEDVILEIGPGPGSLTEGLLESGAHILAVEKDDTLALALKRFKTEENKLEIFCQDIMEFPMEETLKSFLKRGQKAKVIANLPYHLTSHILIKLVQMHQYFSTLVLMVQDEVGRRLTATPGSSQYSSLTVFLNFFSQPRYGFTVSKNCFYPIPKVESSIVIIDLKKPKQVSNEEKFFEMTRTAFEHRRKMLRASLRDLYHPDAIMQALEHIHQNPLARPQDLSVDVFIELFECLNA